MAHDDLKQELAALAYLAITDEILDMEAFASGGTVPRVALEGIARKLGLDSSQGKVELAQAVADHYGMVWMDGYASSGSTITRKFWLDLIARHCDQQGTLYSGE